VTGIAGGEDESVTDAAPLAVGNEAHSPEVHLQLAPRLRVRHPHGDALCPSGAETLDTEADEGPIGDDDALAGEQLVRLHHREVCGEELLDRLLLGEEGPPGVPVAVGADGTNLLTDETDQLVGELGLVPVADKPRFEPGGDVAPGGLAIDAGRAGGGTFTLAAHPASQHFSDFDHRHLPEHGHPRLDDEVPSRTAVRPEVVDAQVVPRLATRVVPCHWQKPPSGGPLRLADDTLIGLELGHVRDPALLRSAGGEVPLQQVRRRRDVDLASPPLLPAVRTDQVGVAHETGDALPPDADADLAQLTREPRCPIGAP
jgi:hypothetical protein